MESFEMWCWNRMEKIRWTDIVKNKSILYAVNKERNIPQKTKKTEGRLIGMVTFCVGTAFRNMLLKEGLKFGRRRIKT
jgi:hypothetical protein